MNLDCWKGSQPVLQHAVNQLNNCSRKHKNPCSLLKAFSRNQIVYICVFCEVITLSIPHIAYLFPKLQICDRWNITAPLYPLHDSVIPPALQPCLQNSDSLHVHVATPTKKGFAKSLSIHYTFTVNPFNVSQSQYYCSSTTHAT